MTTSGLRREASRGKLVIERIAGKDYTTLHQIKLMRELCRVQANELGRLSLSPDTVVENSSPGPSGSETISPQDALRARLRQRRLEKQSKR
jgi:hypothetical protein